MKIIHFIQLIKSTGKRWAIGSMGESNEKYIFNDTRLDRLKLLRGTAYGHCSMLINVMQIGYRPIPIVTEP